MTPDESIVKIIEPSEEIFEIITFYKNLISDILPKSKITLIGSFAIPMCGKEEFDLLVEVDDVEKAQQMIREKSHERMNIGPIVDGEGYCRSKKKFGIICELHIVPKGHKKIQQYADLIDKLKSNQLILEKYTKLKKSLNGLPESQYKAEKDKFLKENNLI